MIRHPETEGNVLGNSGMARLERPNHLFIPTTKGSLQVDNVVEAYRRLELSLPTAIYCSTFLRTRVIAEAFQKISDCPILEDSRLNEKWDGIFHSLPIEEIEEKYSEQIRLRDKIGWYHYTPLGGENGPTVEVRIRSLMRDLGKNFDYASKTILLGTHGNWQFLFEKIALHQTWQEVEEARKNNPIPNCAISVYHFEPPNKFERTLNRYTSLGEEGNTTYA